MNEIHLDYYRKISILKHCMSNDLKKSSSCCKDIYTKGNDGSWVGQCF